ncbi:adhesion G-protein coupled receptor G5 isoform X2 [Brachyhypopomus gauderio]|uniref:adhesion G-protein coupled receptor G5 isoform X2 n=1 Tax=Brachyhypopomus gauderio TaxID=698409 RepID=UPI004040F37D
MSWKPAIKFGICSFLMIMATIWIFPPAVKVLDQSCFLSFDTNQRDNNTGCTYKDIGLWLLKNNTIYSINITREKPRPTSLIFLNGTCNNTLQGWIKNEKFSRCTDRTPTVHPDCNIKCLNPNDICQHTMYKPCTDNSNDDNIVLGDSKTELKCFKCGTPFQEPEGQINLNIHITPQDNKTINMVAAMANLTTTVLALMGNRSTMSVSLPDAQGIFVKPKTPQKPDTVSFAYSNVTNLSIIQDETQIGTFPRTISVPKEAFEKSLKQNSTTLFVSVFLFTKFIQDEKHSTVLDNEVYSIEMGADINNLMDTINLTFRNIDTNGVVPFCHSWNGSGSQPNWITEGCNTTTVNGSVTCECQHLTFFALLMVPNPANISSSDFNNLTYITSIGCGVSLFFLCVALFMHFLLSQARSSDSLHILIHLFVALSLLNLTFLTNTYVANTYNKISCKLMAGFMHYCLLASFTWFGLEALHICLQLTKNTATIKHYLTKICIAGWVSPAITVAVLFCVGKYDELVLYTDTGNVARMCWIVDSITQYVVNIGFYSVIFLFTLMTFTFMLRWLCLARRFRGASTQGNVGSGQSSSIGTSDALTVMGLCSMFGLTWGFAFFAYGALRLPAYYIFTVLNSCQGFFLFIYYYCSSKLVGEEGLQSGQTESTTTVENPYAKPKIF